ncbi:helix-turn-helix domain-containing protein [Reichenbachiella sp. MALMAid0571]|uniref:helix-turn-helix domain-containing protein n=1 Tax=Reichenbachiella sp. MALMAid0571 TaxID=3143939 RepID=UPI0032DF32D3
MEKAQVNENIKFLRKKEGYTQETFADVIGIKRSLVGAYEEGRADPRLNNLLKMSEVFGVSVDTIISKDVSKLSNDELYEKSTDSLKVLSITVDSEDNENIELIPQKASAGYLNGYADPQYIESLPKFRLPMLPGNTTYRAFEISGDSMLPLLPGTVIIGEYVEKPEYIKNGKTYVLVSKDEGVVYKRVFNYMEEGGKLFLVSDNKSYSPYKIKGEDVLEIWEAKAFISVNFPDEKTDPDMTIDQLTNIVMELKQEITKIKGEA